MFRIGRRAILADRGARAIVRVESVVAVGAEAAERAEPECVVVPSMRRDVVGDGRWSDDAAFQAELTQRRDRKLMRSAALPASSAVPAMDVRRVRHRGSMPDKRAFARDARPGFLHFPKKPFALKAARCDLSTVQVLARTCVRHFWGKPELF